MSREKFFLEAANGEDLAAEGDFSGHCQVAAHRNFAERAGDGGSNGDAGGGAVFGYGAFGNMDMEIESSVEVTSEAEAMGAGADVGERGLGRIPA